MNLTRRTALGAGAVFGLSATASRAQSTRWQFATPYPDGNFHTVNNRAFVKEIEAASGGKLAVQVHSNAALLKMGEIKRGVQTGQAQLGEILISSYGNEDPFFEVDGIPQLVTSYAQSRKLADLSRPYIEARLQRQGLSLLYMVPWPPSGFYTNAPVSTLDALKGTKFRTYNVMTSRFATLVGATPTLVQQAELPQAFATGVVNAMVTSAQTGVDVQAWDFCKVFTPIGFTWTKNIVMVSRRALEALPADLQTKIRDLAKAAEARGWAESEKAKAATEKALADKGMQVLQPSKELLAGMDAVSKTITDEWVAKAGADGKKLIDAYRAAIA